MEALLLQDGAYVNDRYEELQEGRRQKDQNGPAQSVGVFADCSSTFKLSDEERQQLEHWRIVQRAKALYAKGPTPQLTKRFLVLQNILDKLYAEKEADLYITSPSNNALKRPDTIETNVPIAFKELPLPTQIVLKMFFRTCQSLRDPLKLAVNSRLSVQIAAKLPSLLTSMPTCVLSPGLTDEVPVELEDEGNVWSVFYQLFQLFEELLGIKSDCMGEEKVCLSASDRATVVVAYVALSLKWGRLGYLLKGIKLLLENDAELGGVRLEPLQPLFRELAEASVERAQTTIGEEDQPCGYLMSFGKGDHGKLGHGQCVHVSCQEGNCTENKLVPTMIAATRDILFRRIDSLSTHSIAITAKGDAMAWGNGDKYRLGHGSSTKEYTPRMIEHLRLKGRVRDLACGLGHTLALMESGELFAWGNGSNGRLGLGDTNDRSNPTRVILPTIEQGKEADGGPESCSTSVPVRFRHIFCGASHSLGLSWDGRAYTWGKNNQGQCGHGHTNDQWTIQEIESFEDGEEAECVTYAAGGWEHTLFSTASGRVYSCGCGYKDSRRAGIPPVLGHGDCDRRLKPTLIQSLEDAREEIVKVACGWDHSLAVSASGKVYTWGSGTNGKLGHGDEESFDTPTLVRTMEGRHVKDAKAGCEHTVFLTYDHELWSCGQGDSGRLGHGDSQTRKRPTKIGLFGQGGLKPVALAVGDKYNLVLVRDNDAQYEGESESEPASISKAQQQASSSHGATRLNNRLRTGHKRHQSSREKEFGAIWVLSVADGINPKGNSPTTTYNDPDSARSAALFIAGHVDRLATGYTCNELDGKRHDLKVSEPNLKAQKTILIPYTTDTSYASLDTLLHLLWWFSSCEGFKEKTARGDNDLEILERMALALSCLRILQLNLKKSLEVYHLPVQTGGLYCSESGDLFRRVHKLLDSLAGLKGEDSVGRFSGSHRSDGVQNLIAIGNAVSHEAACALKMGFGMFYPTAASRCSLLWEILDDCKVDTPSMRTVIVSDQLCKDSTMTEIFKSLLPLGLLRQNVLPADMSATGKDIFDIKTLMIVLVRRSSAEAIKHLDNEAFSDFTNAPDCFLRLLLVLQMHYFSIVHRSATEANGTGASNRQILDSLHEYIDVLMAESLAVLRRLHTSSRQHEEIITWRLNGSFFQTLLPGAIECLAILLVPVSKSIDNLVLVERILPNLHVMLKMLDEVSWKMHTGSDNQTHDDTVTPLGSTAQDRNWFVDLADVCAVLCGKLSCELFHPWGTFTMGLDENTQRGNYYSLVMSQGRLETQDVLSTRAHVSNSIHNILEWERLGVFEVEDELVGANEDATASSSLLSSTDHGRHVLLQLCDADFPSKSMSFWTWVAAKLSKEVDITIETQRLLMLVVSVSSWHLGLSSELRSVYELYVTAAQGGTAIDSVAPIGRIWDVFSVLLSATKSGSWIYDSVDSEIVTNAIELSKLLLRLQPNPVFVPHILRCEDGDLETDESMFEMFEFLTKSHNVRIIEHSLAMKIADGALLRTGICILHDLLRKLTTSSSKSCLLDEFVAVTLRVNLVPAASNQIIRIGEHGHPIDKAIENLFVRLARVVSNDQASFELKKKALMAWTVPLSTSNRGIPSVVALIAKSGLMSTLVELLLDEANVLDTHIDTNALTHPTDYQECESKVPTMISPVKSLLFDQTPGQIISILAWEAFCAIAIQLSKSDIFAEHRQYLLLRSSGSNVHGEPLTPRSTVMSPRRRLTLPKKMVISSTEEIIEQMTDGLFLMLEGTKTRLDALEMSSQEYAEVIRPLEKNIEKQDYSRVCLFGSPVQFSHSNSCDIAIPKANTSEATTSLTVAFWVYVEHTGAAFPNNEAHTWSKESSVRVITLSTNDSSGPDSSGSLVVFTRDASSDDVSIGLSIKCEGDTTNGWCSVFVDEHIPRRRWIQIVLSFDKDKPEQLQIFVAARRSTLSNSQQSADRYKIFCSEVLQKATLWTQMTVGGVADMDTLTNRNETNAPELQRLPALPKKPIVGFTAVVDDVFVAHKALPEDIIARMQCNGPVLFRLKQRCIAENHCAKVLGLLCQLVGTGEELSSEGSPAKHPSSNRWATLLTHMLARTCRDQDLAQVYLCHFLQVVLPRASPLAEFDVEILGQKLFGSRQMKTMNLEEFFIDLNENTPLLSTSTIRRQNEALYRTMHQRGILHGYFQSEKASDETKTGILTLKLKASMRFAAAVHLFQTLCCSPLWRRRMDQFIETSGVIFQNSGVLQELFEAEDCSDLSLAKMSAVVGTIAGYAEQVVNSHRASVQEAAILPSAIQAYNSPFDSVVRSDNDNHVRNIQALVTEMLSEETKNVLHLPARKDILAKRHNDIVATNALDQRIASVAHQRARVLRVLMTALLREQSSATSNSWHHFVLNKSIVCDSLLLTASSSLKEQIVALLGPDAKIAMKLRRLRIFLKEILRGGKHHRNVPLTVTLADLENLQWRLWEEFSTRSPSTSLYPWWQSSQLDGRLSLEVIGGEVELNDLRVKALEHFPTVHLSQASISASSGLWFFEVVVLTDGLMQIGYVDGDFTADPLQGQGVGDHTNSWAFDGFRCKRWNVNSYDYGEQWKADDVVGVLLDTDRMEMSYFLNGKFLGVAFSGIPMTSSSRMCPAASLNVHQSAEFHFGTRSIVSSSEVSSFRGFKYLPVLDNDDQSRFRPVIAALDSVDNLCKEGNGSSEDWSTSGDSDTDGGDITLAGSDSLSSVRRTLNLCSRDGRDTHSADQNDEENAQRRRDLVEGLTGLGFPLEWVTRCATETRMSMDETGAVAWILEQMEKESAQDGASKVPPRAGFKDDGMIHLPGLVVSQSADTFAADSGEVTELEDKSSNVPIFRPPRSSFSGITGTALADINAFIDAEKDQQSDETSSDAFQSDLYRQRHIGRQTLSDLALTTEENEQKSKRGVDDLVPLRAVVDTTLFVSYSRQAVTSLLLLASKEEEQEAVYRMVHRLLSSQETSTRLRRFLKIGIGLDTLDSVFEWGYISERFGPNGPFQLQKSVVALLKYEARALSRSSPIENLSESSPFLGFFCQEMLGQCDRGLSLTRSKQSEKSGSETRAIQAEAAWFAWVSGVVIEFVEDQSLAVEKESHHSDVVVPLFSSVSFAEKLVTIASSPSTTLKTWKYVAFRLMTRIVFVIRARDSLSEFLSATQLTNLTELFTLRCRREMYSRVFYSDVTNALFALLVRSSAHDSGQDKTPSESHNLNLRVNNYSATHVTISWDQTSAAQMSATFDNLTDTSTTEDNSGVMLLRVSQDTRQRPDSDSSVTKALPSKGAYTIRNLLPDTQYRIRLDPAEPIIDSTSATTPQGTEIKVQTPPEPVFELDRESVGKNLVVDNQNLTATNTVNKKWHSVRTSVAFEEGIHSWQVRLDTCVSKNIFIGVCTADASMDNYVGSDAYGYGFLANKAIWHNKAKLHSYGEILKQGDVIQVTLDCNARALAFSRNGEYLGIAATNMRAGTNRADNDGNCKWFPAFSMYNKDDKVTLIPPPAATTFATKDGRSQNASTLELIEAMQSVLTYQRHVTGVDISCTRLFEKAFEEFDHWRRGEVLFRETCLGQVIAISKSKSIKEKYGLAFGDTVFTSKGQCTVLGEYRHELWYEVDEGGGSSLYGTASPSQLASWSLSTCREMLESPDEYPVHRLHKYKESSEADSVEHQTSSDITEHDEFSFQSFVDAQMKWCENGDVAGADSKIIAKLDAIASSQSSNSAVLLSYADISMALLLERSYGTRAELRANQVLARIGFLLHVNRCLYRVVRLAIPRNIFATSLGVPESPECLTKSNLKEPPIGCMEYPQVSPVATLLNSPHWTAEDPSAFSQIAIVAGQLLFSSQKEKLIERELDRTMTTSRTLDSVQDPCENEDVGDLPVVKIRYPFSTGVPFWECSSAMLKRKTRFWLPKVIESSIFLQLAKQLTAQDARQWRRSSTQPFEAIPISQTFRVRIEKQPTESSGEIGQDEFDQQQQDEDDEDQLQQPSSKQTAKYLNLFESAVREIQSPSFPLFAPVQGIGKPLQLDVNLELFSPIALAHSRVPSSQLLLWYFCFGQILGITWRSKLLLPLQFITTSFWEELVDSLRNEDRNSVRDVSICAIRDGFFSIIPSRCVVLLSGNNSSLRELLSDLDVNFVTRLERHATYSVSRQRHHDSFWNVVNAFTSVERRMLEQFVNSERRRNTKRGEVTQDTDNSANFVLEMADALADGRDHPDSCYPVVVSTGQQSSRLHLPAYSSAQTLRQKLLLAMTNVPFV
ncbi:Ubiquitin-transferase HECT domain-containing protein [Phytophthora infestans]|uniref:Ubiquitin-transferase HECT domain-containing protein n=1 Tax=Phytophthora infestans TaxID=4787 RepID=A0A8S9V1E7_PHYIN|nr:Ubiquitin-transferase HECT domain-containing protein [Phytophthora infestans]